MARLPAAPAHGRPYGEHLSRHALPRHDDHRAAPNQPLVTDADGPPPGGHSPAHRTASGPAFSPWWLPAATPAATNGPSAAVRRAGPRLCNHIPGQCTPTWQHRPEGGHDCPGRQPQGGPGAVNQQGMLADAPPLGGGMAAPRSNPRVGKGPMGQQMAGAGQKSAGRPGAKAGPTKAPAPQKKRKSDDEGSSGDPPASRRRVGPGSAAMASTGPASVDSGTSTSASDWKAEAALKLERTRQEKAQR